MLLRPNNPSVTKKEKLLLRFIFLWRSYILYMVAVFPKGSLCTWLDGPTLCIIRRPITLGVSTDVRSTTSFVWSWRGDVRTRWNQPEDKGCGGTGGLRPENTWVCNISGRRKGIPSIPEGMVAKTRSPCSKEVSTLKFPSSLPRTPPQPLPFTQTSAWEGLLWSWPFYRKKGGSKMNDMVLSPWKSRSVGTRNTQGRVNAPGYLLDTQVDDWNSLPLTSGLILSPVRRQIWRIAADVVKAIFNLLAKPKPNRSYES